MPCHPARARELLGRRRAVVARHVPFTIRLRDRMLPSQRWTGCSCASTPVPEAPVSSSPTRSRKPANEAP
ncbi:RRXRR domain-containing protein [Streptomyces pharetrae]|uniref:RRXRR domain-containing protein n=1 Tax=Streptomyces pharetrae TaxID=291370 RepID=UPI003650D410